MESLGEELGTSFDSIAVDLDVFSMSCNVTTGFGRAEIVVCSRFHHESHGEGMYTVVSSRLDNEERRFRVDVTSLVDSGVGILVPWESARVEFAQGLPTPNFDAK